MYRAVVTVVALAALLVGPAGATTRGKNGLIVYAEEIGQNPQLFTIRPDGSGTKRLTNVHGTDATAVNADWSPDGEQIVFELTSATNAGIAVMSAEGTGVKNLTPTRYQGQPAFSPDGKWIAFEADAENGNGVFLMQADGKKRQRLTANPFAGGECGCDTDPNFSPDGKFISFVRIKLGERQQALFTIRRDGTGLKQLTPYSWDVAIKHDWSPDGKLIVLTRNADFVKPGQSANLVTIRPEGSGMTELTHFKGGKKNAYVGSFSPDGKQIVLRLENGDTYGLALIGRDGKNLRQITRGKGRPRYIDWGTHQ
jgi:Tol biopolymer transport system component